MTLSPCARCARHVRDDATHCPFCGATMTTSSRARAPSPRRVLAMVAAASALTVAGCDAQSGDDENAKATDPAVQETVAPVDARAADAPVKTAPRDDVGTAVPPYGVAMDPARGEPSADPSTTTKAPETPDAPPAE